jgi:alpha-beta hydrolase superfamily lysophospholipase
MFRRFQPFALFALLPAACLALSPAVAPAQGKDKKPDKVVIPTTDGVKLHGNWYASNQQNAPVVMLLHSPSKTDDSSKKGWHELATALQEKGYAVISFDFRGCGGSTELEGGGAKFWGIRNNAELVRPDRKAMDTISFERYDYRYLPTLVNDIAAVKAYLDKKNDQGEVNTNTTILIGAEMGATLGAIWLNAEWFRYKYEPPDRFNGIPAKFAEYPEGKGVIAAIWLSMSPSLGRTSVQIPQTLAVPVRSKATPTVWLYGAKDEAAARLAQQWEKALKLTDKKYKYIGSQAVAKSEKLSGRELLGPGLGVAKSITDYLDTLTELKAEWAAKDFTNSQYIWAHPPQVLNGPQRVILPAKGARDPLVLFNTYSLWISRIPP